MDQSPDAKHAVWGDAVDGLRLGMRADDGVVRLLLENVGDTALVVLSHVRAHETHLDWYTLHLTDDSGTTRRLALFDSRDRSIPVQVRLEPGERLHHDVDVRGWAQRSFNGRTSLAPGNYRVLALYQVVGREGCWLGRLEAGPVTLTIHGGQ